MILLFEELSLQMTTRCDLLFVLVEVSLWINLLLFDLLVVITVVVTFSTAALKTGSHYDADEC